MSDTDPLAESQDKDAMRIHGGRLIDDEVVARHLATIVELAEGLLTDVDQMSADLDDNRLAIASSVAWLVGDNAREMQSTATLMQARLTWLAGQNIYPLQPDV